MLCKAELLLADVKQMITVNPHHGLLVLGTPEREANQIKLWSEQINRCAGHFHGRVPSVSIAWRRP